ncbi:hypothetical protein M409DRAFT_23238 [Zasmidium cellare ATCC 36951]|uniref:Methyltransferase domain-containing protein n=1 Tax=Zasmidium cellare ATCC 36951 TaxID=1080233 RepID=A0A6A6CHD8_ZASCE|nr:uncharacterized protein M409DRAFT_23238 [Zasmidium cellare ATCC 36951]KAF2166604.1 hypothetical protein M409DRAFT_23238 [Zasmidium cellare ATCC 36951]
MSATRQDEQAVLNKDYSKSDYYILASDFQGTVRLALQQYIWREALGFNIHPSIPPLEPTASIADIACGTTLWLVEVGRQLGPPSDLHAFDVNLQQAPPKEWLPENLTLHKWNFFEDVPKEFKGKFDLVHVRLITVAIKDNNPVPVIKNLFKLLRPGGHLQWDEVDVYKSFVVKAYAELEVPAMDAWCAWMAGTKEGQGNPENEWRRHLTGMLTENGFQTAQRHDEGDRFLEHKHLMRYNSDPLLMLSEQYARRVYSTGNEQGTKLLKTVEAAAKDAENGSAMIMPPIIWVAQKPL